MSAPPEPRRAALTILRSVRSGQTFDRALSDALPGMDDADRRLAHEIAAGVLRERRLLDQRITSALTRPHQRMKKDLSDVLRIGAYQIGFLDRVPSYAAVQTTVELAKNACGPKSAPLVNAVLRRLSHEAPPAPPVGLAETYSHPDWLVDRWTEAFGAEATERLLQHNNTRPPLVIQPARWTSQRLADALEAADIQYATLAHGGIEIHGRSVSDIPGYQDGAFVVQDSSQRLLLDFAAFPSDVLVWDACAAPGGKTTVLAQRGAVVASEPVADRVPRLTENIRRVAPSVCILRADARRPPWAPGSMSAVLVDAPCSATGTIARHPDARWRLSPERIRWLTDLQSEILEGVASVVAPGGLLVYFTCSLEPEENEGRIDRFLSRHQEFQREGTDLHIFPPDSSTDGGFGARMRRAA